MLGWVAAVRATESPSQLRPALIHRTWIRTSSAASSASRVGAYGIAATSRGHLLEPVGAPTPDIRWARPSVYLCGMNCDYAHSVRVSRRSLASGGHGVAGQQPVAPCPEPLAGRHRQRQHT